MKNDVTFTDLKIYSLVPWMNLFHKKKKSARPDVYRQ